MVIVSAAMASPWKRMCINDKIGIGVDDIRVIENKYYVWKKTKNDVSQ